MPPVPKPLPRFVADSPQEAKPYGRWEERLKEEFAKACETHASAAGRPVDLEGVRWFPERGWGGRVYVPATAPAKGGESDSGGEQGPAALEFFGWISFVRPEDEGEPSELRAKADFTDVTAEDNPDWKIDLNDDVIGAWRSEGDRGGDITLIWGLPLVRGAIAATAELNGEVVDQAAVQDGRFTLVAADAVKGFGDDLFVQVILWDRTLRAIATETLYD